MESRPTTILANALGHVMSVGKSANWDGTLYVRTDRDQTVIEVETPFGWVKVEVKTSPEPVMPLVISTVGELWTIENSPSN